MDIISSFRPMDHKSSSSFNMKDLMSSPYPIDVISLPTPSDFTCSPHPVEIARTLDNITLTLPGIPQNNIKKNIEFYS